MLKKSPSAIVLLTLGFALALPPRAASARLLSHLILAPSLPAAPTLPLLSPVAKDTRAQRDALNKGESLNQNLQQRFAAVPATTDVVASATAAPAAISSAPATVAQASPSPQAVPSPTDDAAVPSGVEAGLPPWLWFIPLLLGGLGLWWWLKREQGNDAPLPAPTATGPAVPPAVASVEETADGGTAIATGTEIAAAERVTNEEQSSPLSSPEDLGTIADPAVFDLPHAVSVEEEVAPEPAEMNESLLPSVVLAGSTIAGVAVPDAAVTQDAPVDSSLVSLDAVEFGEGNPQEEDSEFDSQVIDLTEGGIPDTRSLARSTAAVQMGGAFLAAGVGVAAGAMRSSKPPTAVSEEMAQTEVEAAKFDVGLIQESLDLSDVDAGLRDLPDGYGESRIVLLPRDPQSAYAYWDIPNEHKEELRRQGGQQLALRLCDVTDLDANQQSPHSMQQYDCDEMTRNWHLPIPVSDRDYLAEIGYIAADGRWLRLAQSLPVRIPPVYPSDWFEEHFITIDWNQDLRNRKFLTLVPPSQRGSADSTPILHEQMFTLAGGLESMHTAGSLFGSMQQVPLEGLSSFVFPSGMGALPTPSGMGMSGIGMSGIGFAASIPPIRSRKFWLVADAELIIYGATEPDATVTIGGRPITLNPDGTFRFQMSFQDGLLDFPIWATAVDGEQNRSIQMKFTRETPQRRTNTKDQAIDEPF